MEERQYGKWHYASFTKLLRDADSLDKMKCFFVINKKNFK